MLLVVAHILSNPYRWTIFEILVNIDNISILIYRLTLDIDNISISIYRPPLDIDDISALIYHQIDKNSTETALKLPQIAKKKKALNCPNSTKIAKKNSYIAPK